MVQLKRFLLSGLVAVATAKSAVLDLIPSNFDDVVLKSGKATLVEFFAPWCGHCKTLAPIYEELGAAFQFAQDKVQIAKVDADANRGLGQRFGVQGFPTLKFFDGKSDKPIEYSGARDLESLSAFITEHTSVRPRRKISLPSNVVYLDDKSFETQVGGDKNILVAFTAPWCGHCKTLAPLWESLANDFELDDNVIIAKVDCESENSKATAQSQGIASYPTIKFFPKGDKTGEHYDGARAEPQIISFLNEKTGTKRAAGGSLNGEAGLLDEFNEFVTKLHQGGEVAALAAEARAAVPALEGLAEETFAKYYVRVFDKLQASEGFVAKEMKRLEGILDKGGLAPAKRDQLTIKVNILRQFSTPPSKKEEDKDSAKDEL